MVLGRESIHKSGTGKSVDEGKGSTSLTLRFFSSLIDPRLDPRGVTVLLMSTVTNTRRRHGRRQTSPKFQSRVN